MPRYLLEIEALTPNPVVEACIQFMGRVEMAVNEVPLPTGPYRHLVAKLTNARLGVQIPPESRDFDASEWVSQLAQKDDVPEFTSLVVRLNAALKEY